MGGDASLCDPGGESYDTDWFEVAKVGLTLSKYDQLVWTKEAKGCEDRTHGEMLKAELYSALVQTAEGCWNSYTRDRIMRRVGAGALGSSEFPL
ncbi:hypothetical protein N7536_005816 [Penicillium majusculum]|nr:hypothetical protein N7536_005816 [Penicillium majusculum]